jgi:glycosyltransferase involved in cell wall biosynthesis
VRVIRNGIDAYRFRSLPDSGIAIRKRLGIPQTAPVCGIVAALRPEKNHLLFLRAAALASQQAPDAHFVLIGDGPERQKLERAVVDTKLAGRVHMLGTRNDIPQLLSAMDVFSLTSHNEANPVSILEAMACEVPVVATRVGSVVESVAHESTGFLVEPGNAEGLAKHWLQVFAEKELASRMGATAREKVIAQGSLDKMVEGYTELISEIYDAKCPPGSLCGPTKNTAKKVTA